jgi:hypothetical protein
LGVTDIDELRWWERPERLDESDQQQLLRAAASVLARKGDVDVGGDNVADIPPRALSASLHAALGKQGVSVSEEEVRGLVDGPRAREAAPALLTELGREPRLREAINDAVRASGELMVVEPASWALTAAVVLLIVKLRRIRIDKTGIDVELDPVREGVLKQVLGSFGA